MDQNEIETLLTKEFEEQKIMPFSSRWQELKNSIASRDSKRKMFFLLAPILAFCATAITIVISLSFFSNKPEHYFSIYSIAYEPVSNEEFIFEMQKINLLNQRLLNLPIDDYALAKIENSLIIGGNIIFNNSSNAEDYIFSITILSNSVVIDEGDFSDLELEIKLNNFSVKYKTYEDILYESEAFIVGDNLMYLIKYTSLKNDFINFISLFI